MSVKSLVRSFLHYWRYEGWDVAKAWSREEARREILKRVCNHPVVEEVGVLMAFTAGNAADSLEGMGKTVTCKACDQLLSTGKLTRREKQAVYDYLANQPTIYMIAGDSLRIKLAVVEPYAEVIE